MAYKEYRINTNINNGENLLKVNLKRDIDTFKILSLSINTEDAYQYPSSNYGVIVGRVLANNAFGVPNVKVSVFVPLGEEDEMLSQIYPYKAVNSVDDGNIPYNLIQTRAYKGIDGLHTTNGTFPSKRMVLDNETVSEAYDKYWKYTTVTNEAGDYMLFGIPTGNCQVHFECDLSDVGLISQRPYDFINKGYSAELFKSPTEFKDENIANAVQIKRQNNTVFVYPFWGDKTTNQIGITRNDLNLDYTFEPCCVFMGSSISDSVGSYFAVNGQPMGSIGRFKSLVTHSGDIEIIRKTEEDVIEEYTKNVKGVIDGNGVWCYSIPMNLDRIGTDEEGNTVAIHKPNAGIPTRARMRMRITLNATNSNDNGEMVAKMLIPNNPKLKGWGNVPELDESVDGIYEFGSKTPDSCFRDFYWGKVYSVKQYIPRLQFESTWHPVINTCYRADQLDDAYRGQLDYADYPETFAYPFSCISSIDVLQGYNAFPYTTMYSGAENQDDIKTYAWFKSKYSETASNNGYAEKGLHFCFENDWINGCLYFPRCQVIGNNEKGWSYFGADNPNYGSHMVVTGRHNFYPLPYGAYTIRSTDISNQWWATNENSWQAIDQDNSSIYSHVKIHNGIVVRKLNPKNQSIFYYACGAQNLLYMSSTEWEMFYATDIILLGNMVDIYDSLPKIYQNLPSTTCTFPPLVPPYDLTEAGMNAHGYTKQLEKMYSNKGYDSSVVTIYGDGMRQDAYDWLKSGDNLTLGDAYNEHKNSPLWKACLESSGGQDKFVFGPIRINIFTTPNPESLITMYKQLFARFIERSSVFFGERVWGCHDFLFYFPAAFVNTSRICELDVENNKQRETSNGTFPINGLITRQDITKIENRSAFASMNYDITGYDLDSKTAHRHFHPSNLFLTDFDGRLWFLAALNKIESIDENNDVSYLQFRYGSSMPMWYHCTYFTDGFTTQSGKGIENAGALPITVNSLYFYFGLRSGSSALDKFNNKYGIQTISDASSLSQLITITQDSESSCSGGTKSYTVQFHISKSVPAPITATVMKSNRSYPINKVNAHYLTGHYGPGVYVLYITDANNNSTSKRFVVKEEPINIVTTTLIVNKNGQELNAFKITQIGDYLKNSNGLSYACAGDCKSLVFSNEQQTSSVYSLTFDEGLDWNMSSDFVSITTSGSTLSGYLSEAPGLAAVACQTERFTIEFHQSTNSDLTLCNIPYDMLCGWQGNDTSANGDRIFPSLLCQYADKDCPNIKIYSQSTLSYPYNFSNSTVSEQLKCVSTMMQIVYGGYMASLTPSITAVDYSPIVITPKVDTILQADGIKTKQQWAKYNDTTTFSGETKPQEGRVSSPYANLSYDLPHIVGQNFPTAIDAKSCMKYSDYVHYHSNNYYTINGCSDLNVDYYGYISNYEKSKDHPQNILNDIRFITDQPNLQLSNHLAQKQINLFGIQTVDKRFDYQFYVQTPTFLPSGYDNFTNLSDKTLSKGAFEANIYGGIRMDENLACYNTSGIILSGHPTSDAVLFNQKILDGSNAINVKVRKKHIWDVSYNDEIALNYNKLSGETELSLSFVGCGDFSNKTIQPGKNMALTISYDSGINLIEKIDLISDDYDVMYALSGESGTSYTLYGSLSGSTLEFALNTDSSYAGSTYTDICTDKWHNFYVETKSPSTVAKPLANSKAIGIVLDNGTSFEVERLLTSGHTSFTNLSYDETKCYFATYGTDSDTLLSDTDAANCYKFRVKSNGEAFNPETLYLSMPTHKLYKEDTDTLLKQGIVYNMGYAYYAAKINVTHKIENNKLIQYLTLYTPLDNNGKINWQTTDLKGHTIGDITTGNYRTTSGKVTYSQDYHRFEITYDVGTKGNTELYFKIANGLKYKVVAPINAPAS